MSKTGREDGGKQNTNEFSLPEHPSKATQHGSPHRSSFKRNRDEAGLTEEALQPEIILSGPPPDEEAKGHEEEKLLLKPGNIQDRIPATKHPRTASSLSNPYTLRKIHYTLHLTFLRRDAPNLTIDITPPAAASENILKFAEQAIRDHVHDECPHELDDKEILFRTGTAVVKSLFIGRQTHDLSIKSDWNLQRVKGLTNIGRIRVDIHRDYIALRVRAEAGETFANTKRGEITSLKCKAADNCRYFPRVDIELVACLGTIEKVMAEDPPPNMSSADREVFVHDICQDARILFAMCIHAQLKMKCLKVLFDKGWNDAKLKSRPLTESDKCHDTCACNSNYDNLVSWQKSFRAAEFLKIGQHQDLDTEQVLPYQYCPITPEEARILQGGTTSESPEIPVGVTISDPSDMVKARCGIGAHSKVFRIRMNPDHHKLTVDKNAMLAVKEFLDPPDRRGGQFEKELKVLERLRKYPHPHIVTHLATWLHNDKYYMLFPYATCNLRNYMATWKFGRPRRRPTLWMLAQLRGLANALRSIHNLSEEKETLQLAVPSRETAWHHDLKPDNILFFSTKESPQPDDEEAEGTFRIADFGSAKINTLRSRTILTKSPLGTPTYEPPERETKKLTSRPYDVWSLGCVFLELLVWALFGYHAVEQFRRQRLNDCDPLDPNRFDFFWLLKRGEDDAIIRPAVTKQIVNLREKIERKKHLPFDGVLVVVGEMLAIDPLKRADAVRVWNRLDQICASAEANYDPDEDIPDTPVTSRGEPSSFMSWEVDQLVASPSLLQQFNRPHARSDSWNSSKGDDD